MVEMAMQERGIEVLKGRDAVGIARQRVVLDDGQEIGADAVIVGKGVRPNVGFLAGSGIAVNYGVVVDETMRTNIDNIYAAGDIAEGDDFLTGQPVTYGIWPVAIDQGRVAGARMVGREEAYEGSLKMNVTKLFGVTAAVVGDVDSGAEEVVYEDRERRLYRRITFDEAGRVTGAVLVGLVEDVGVLGGVIKRRLRSGELRKSIARNPLSTAQLLRQCLEV
jgi:phenylglyoxylate dehydrogenase epsilon subunit